MSKKKDKSSTRTNDPKAQLYANLARYGIWRVVIAYDGCGDSGCIGDITLYGADEKPIPMPEMQVNYTTDSHVYCDKTKRYEPKRTPRSGPLREAIETWCYDLLEEHFGGWENDGGADGTIELNVPLKSGHWEHNTYYTETSTNVMEV